MGPQGKWESLAPPLGRRELQGEWAQQTLALGHLKRADVLPPTRGPPWGPSPLPPPPRWLVSRRPGHRAQLLAIERVGMEAWLPRFSAFLPLSGKRGGCPTGPGSLPKGLHARLLAPELLGRGED